MIFFFYPHTEDVWFYFIRYRLEQATGLAFRFVIGRTKDAKKMAELEKEIDKYKDFMIIDIEEEYLRLPNKTYGWHLDFLS